MPFERVAIASMLLIGANCLMGDPVKSRIARPSAQEDGPLSAFSVDVAEALRNAMINSRR